MMDTIPSHSDLEVQYQSDNLWIAYHRASGTELQITYAGDGLDKPFIAMHRQRVLIWNISQHATAEDAFQHLLTKLSLPFEVSE